MFIVANISKGTIVISDLGVEIPPNQSRDLHKIPTKMPPEKSKDLKNATGSGRIKEIKRDPPPPGLRTEHTTHHEKVIHEKRIIEKGSDKDEIVEALFEKLKKEMPFLQNGKPKEEATSNEVLAQMMKQIEALNRSITGGAVPRQPQPHGDEGDADDYEVDSSLLSQIHARAVEKLTKNTEGDISYSQSEEKDKSMSKGIDELEELLG